MLRVSAIVKDALRRRLNARGLIKVWVTVPKSVSYTGISSYGLNCGAVTVVAYLGD